MTDHSLICSECHTVFDTDLYDSNNPLFIKMKEQKLCFSCMFWKHVLNNRPANNYIINGGLWEMYPIKGLPNKRCIKKDSLFMRNINTGAIIASSSCTFRGAVPQHFKNRLPDEFKFITKDTFLKILDYKGTRCKSKGCFDRYYCFWYDESLETNGPWNKIPPTYTIGCEHCESFINKKNMYEYNNHYPFNTATNNKPGDNRGGKKN